MEENVSGGVAAQSGGQATNTVPGATPGETVSETMKRMYKVTVDGQDMEVDEDELRKGYTHGKAASKRMEEASMTRKEAEQVLRIFKENPREAFKMLGTDARKFAEQVINDELSEALLSPQERELRDYKAKVDRYESESRSAKEQYEREQLESSIAQQAEAIQSDIIGSLESSGLPKTERTVSRMVYYMQAALQAGFNVTPKDVVDQVRADYKADLNSMLGGLPEDALEAFLGADVVKRIAKSTVKTSMPIRSVDKSVNLNKAPRATEEKKVTSPRDYFKRR